MLADDNIKRLGYKLSLADILVWFNDNTREPLPDYAEKILSFLIRDRAGITIKTPLSNIELVIVKTEIARCRERRAVVEEAAKDARSISDDLWQLNSALLNQELELLEREQVLRDDANRISFENCPVDHSSLELYGAACPACGIVEGSDMK